MAPIKCPWLTRCPPGTDQPRFSSGIFLFLITVAIVSYAFYLRVRRTAKVQAQRAANAGDREQLNMLITLLTRLSQVNLRVPVD
jgi:hypothetical protein